jgi:hypothetical protein
MKRASSISPNQRPEQVSYSVLSDPMGSRAVRLQSCRPNRGRWHRGSEATMRRKKSMVQPTQGRSCAGLGARQDKCGWRLRAKASLHRALQQKISVKRHFSRIFPVFPSVTRYGAFPAPGGTRRSASRCARPSGLGFQTKNLPRRNTRGSNPKNGRDFFLGASAERHAFGTWERGTSRRFAQECPEGNPGKFKHGEITWHATKTKSR